ncbi:MAG: SufD family Fe-S cluster assembly protein [Clostridiales bacterium]|nr:SufD family Fe-S cluster assembly protein [Clostridiales bacterium]
MIRNLKLNEMRLKTWQHLNVNEVNIEEEYITEKEIINLIKENKCKYTNVTKIYTNNESNTSFKTINTLKDIELNNINKEYNLISLNNLKSNKQNTNIKDYSYIYNKYTYELNGIINKTIKIDEINIKNKEKHTINNDNNIYIKEYLNIIANENSNSYLVLDLNKKNYKNRIRNTNKIEDINIQIDLKDNSKVDMVIIFPYDKIKGISLENLHINSEKKSDIHISCIFMGRKQEYFKITSLLNEETNVNIDGIYLTYANNTLDMYFDTNHIGKNGKSYININGVMIDDSRKSWKGIITFHNGCSGSEGEENENLLMLSENAKSKTLPILLCREIDVKGNHGSSSGNMDNQKIFYLMSRGHSKENARKIIIMSRFNPIIDRITNNEIKENVISIIEEEINKTNN